MLRENKYCLGRISVENDIGMRYMRGGVGCRYNLITGGWPAACVPMEMVLQRIIITVTF